MRRLPLASELEAVGIGVRDHGDSARDYRARNVCHLWDRQIPTYEIARLWATTPGNVYQIVRRQRRARPGSVTPRRRVPA